MSYRGTSLAESVEHVIPNLGVTSSSPRLGLSLLKKNESQKIITQFCIVYKEYYNKNSLKFLRFSYVKRILYIHLKSIRKITFNKIDGLCKRKQTHVSIPKSFFQGINFRTGGRRMIGFTYKKKSLHIQIILKQHI